MEDWSFGMEQSDTNYGSQPRQFKQTDRKQKCGDILPNLCKQATMSPPLFLFGLPYLQLTRKIHSGPETQVLEWCLFGMPRNESGWRLPSQMHNRAYYKSGVFVTRNGVA